MDKKCFQQLRLQQLNIHLDLTHAQNILQIISQGEYESPGNTVGENSDKFGFMMSFEAQYHKYNH